MTTTSPERHDWREYPELRIVRPSTSLDTAGHTCNHDAAKAAHVAHLYTEIAPGPTIRRRRVDWIAVADHALRLMLALMAVIGAVLLAHAGLGGLR